MSNSEPPSPVLFFETLVAYQNTAALKAALDLKLFTAIGQSHTTAAELAAKCGAAERGIRILADYLTILGFLEKNGDRFLLLAIQLLFSIKNHPPTPAAPRRFFFHPRFEGRSKN